MVTNHVLHNFAYSVGSQSGPPLNKPTIKRTAGQNYFLNHIF